ncbi:MAG: carbonic anhydrase [Potamolinea sp.]
MNGKNQKGNFSRRNLLKFGAGAVGAGVVTAGLGSNLVSPEVAVADNDMSPDQALKMLMEGNQRFVTKNLKNINQNYDRLAAVAQGQKPFAAILGCADSRVPSEIIFDRGFGDLFICRVAGNIATPEEVGSLEFGTLVLGAKVLLVMGHKKCGAVDATIKGAQVPGQIASLLDAIRPSLQNSQGKKIEELEEGTKANALYQAEKLKKSTVISKLIEEGKLKVVSAYYDLNSGTVTILG